MSNSAETRIDVLLFNRRYATSRTDAQRLIEEGLVAVDGEIVTRVSRRFDDTCDIVVTERGTDYVSRGGNKLFAALFAFEIDVSNAVCLDIGISTGGFTDCLLQSGAQSIVGIDVGHGQLHPTLIGDDRVELHEGVNARDLSICNFSTKFDIVTVDVSFISLQLILPQIPAVLDNAGKLICLIKPQFEVGSGRLGKNGVVTDIARREQARTDVHACADSLGLQLSGTITSPIVGGDGNIEFISYFRYAVQPDD